MSVSVTTDFHSSLSTRILLYLGFILLSVLLIGIVDVYFFESRFSHFINLSQAPAFYVPLFAFPHILSSLIILFTNTANKEVMSYVVNRVIPVVVAGIVCYLISKPLFDLMFLVLITQHIAGQALGIVQLTSTKTTSLNRYWKWFNYPALAVAFLMIYTVHLKILTGDYLGHLITLGTLSIVIASLLSVLIFTRTRNWLLLLTQVYFFGVFFFAIKSNILYWGIVFILGHDVVAFLIYQNYYLNRTGQLVKSIGLNIGLPVLLSFSLIALSLKLRTPYLVFFFQFAHYFAERYCWKNSSPLRRFVSIK